MSIFQDVIKDLKGLYPDLKLDESGKSASKQVTLSLDLVLYDDRDPKDWEVVDKKTKAVTLVKDVTGAPKLISLEFISKFNEFTKEATKKDPIENLKGGGLDISDVPDEATEEVDDVPSEIIQDPLNDAEPVNKDYRKKLTPEAIQRADDYTKKHNPGLWEKIKKQREERLAALDAGEIEKPEPVKPARVPAKRESPARKMPAVIPIDMRSKQIAELTNSDIINYLCPKANEKEAMIFLKVCQAKGINPFLKEAYLVKYKSEDPASIVVAKDYFARKAEEHPMYDGEESGIILMAKDGVLERREGAFMLPEENLVGGWCKVYRKDRTRPILTEVAFHEYVQKTRDGTPNKFWNKMSATMIQKVAFSQNHRKAFPGEFSGLYDSSEIEGSMEGLEDSVIEAAYEEVQA